MPDSLQGFVPLPLIEKLLGHALSKGGDFAEIYVEPAAKLDRAREVLLVWTAEAELTNNLDDDPTNLAEAR